ncbi:MAG: hypothetical protein LZF60_380240 [Nitrospira sp.]|nr:MAG: hypothetical protein LZF60_380240 [Nitrospira sp.]
MKSGQENGACVAVSVLSGGNSRYDRSDRPSSHGPSNGSVMMADNAKAMVSPCEPERLNDVLFCDIVLLIRVLSPGQDVPQGQDARPPAHIV